MLVKDPLGWQGAWPPQEVPKESAGCEVQRGDFVSGVLFLKEGSTGVVVVTQLPRLCPL